MTFGMYVHFQETMCRIPILKIVHNYHTSIFPVLQVNKFHLHMTHWWALMRWLTSQWYLVYSIITKLMSFEICLILLDHTYYLNGI